MKKLTEYNIPFGGLKAGEHVFTFSVGKEFLENFDNLDILDIKIEVVVEMVKNNRLLEFNLFLNGTADFECDRCLESVSLPVNYNSKLIVKLEDVDEPEDEIVYLKYDETEFDISRFVYESIVFSAPLRRVHPDDKKGKSTCDPEMIKKLEDLMIKNSKENKDPRWNELKNLLN